MSEYLGSKDVVFMDSEMWFAPYIDMYDRSGRLFEGFIYWLAYRDRPVPDARVAIYPFKRSFVVGALAMDIQAGEHTMRILLAMLATRTLFDCSKARPPQLSNPSEKVA